MANLILGPMLGYVDATAATVWVETDAACEVDVLGRRARTFRVDGHHYAVVAVTGLQPDAFQVPRDSAPGPSCTASDPEGPGRG